MIKQKKEFEKACKKLKIVPSKQNYTLFIAGAMFGIDEAREILKGII